ncbi:MAG TPA: hypothetical protein DCY93_00700 [Firmicutes bacterium]|nr:hypothetical protein [Bacillota bacterium]
MKYLLYNPLSNNGKCRKAADKLNKKFNKKGHKTQLLSLIDISSDINSFVNKLETSDEIYVIGGDGTLHHVINSFPLDTLPCKVYYYSAGHGNDFAREYKEKIINLSEKASRLPYFKIPTGQVVKFINGVGLGVDADVCKVVKDEQKSYISAALTCLKRYQPYSIDINIDGIEHHFDNVFFFVVMNGKYIGGGMKIAPHAKRDDDHLDLLVITSKNYKRLLPLFPFVFLGWHTKSKKHAHEFKCKKVFAKLSRNQNLQSDGEVISDISEIEVFLPQ